MCTLTRPGAPEETYTPIDKRVAFHICAHPDDWILFGGTWAYWNLQCQSTVIVLTTAGDAQCRDAWWQVREQAAVSALQTALEGAPVAETTQLIHGENVRNVHVYTSTGEAKRTALYCLRLFNRAHPNHEPGMWELFHGMSPARTVDNSTVYTSWDDFCLTLRNIVLLESRDATAIPHIDSHLYRSDATINPGDHCEHTLTGAAVRSFAQPFPRAWWWGYETMRHHQEQGWQITDPGLLTGKWRLWSAYREAVQKAVAEGALLTSDSLMWANPDVMDSEWERWGPVGHVEQRWPGQEDL
jgi:hypothetical protein